MDKLMPLGSHLAMSKYISSALSRPSTLPKPFQGADSLDGFKAAIENGPAISSCSLSKAVR